MEQYPRDLSANRFSISRDGRKVFETAEKDALLPYLEWFINNDALDRLTHYYQLHSAVVAGTGGHSFYLGIRAAEKLHWCWGC